jgi:curved DNA-binding protein CbpA
MVARNYFDLLGLPVRAALDEEALQAAFHAASRNAHPDQAGGDAALSAELNAAVETLKSPVSRLRHLIETQAEAKWRAVPLDQEMMALFERLGPLLQHSQAFLNKKKTATSALGRALLATEEMTLREALEELNGRIEVQWRAMEERLPAWDARMAAGDAAAWADLQAEQARFAYLAKWRAQIREALLGLML